MNSKSNGHVTFVTTQQDESEYFVGFVYEFAIVMENKSREKLLDDLREAASGYLQVVRENNLLNTLLDKHQLLPEDLQNLYIVAKNDFEKKKRSSGIKVPTKYKESLDSGLTQLSTACV